MRLRQLLMCAFLAGGPWCTASNPTFSWWTTHPLEKIRPTTDVPDAPAKQADLFAARNEFEPFQIVIRANSRDVAAIDLEVSDLHTAQGAVLARNNITLYREEFLDLPKASSVEGDEGPWPDPLIPRVDRYANEKRNAFPFTVARGRNQPVWVEIFVPPATVPGRYSGTVRVTSAGAPLFSVPVNLTVWQFTLPSTSSLKTSFGFSGINALKQHYGRYTNDDDLRSITSVYARAALQHRISINGGTMQPPKYEAFGKKVDVDWSGYDAEVGKLLDGAAIPKGEPLYGARATSAEVRGPKAFENEDQEKAYWSAWTRHFQQKGWSDRLFLYLWDEPKPANFPELIKRGRLATQVEPKLRSLVTIPYQRELADVVQIWVPLVNCLEPKPGFPDFCNNTPPLEVYAQQAKSNGSLWFYQSCASHGCNIVGGEYFTGWPAYVIDIQGAANRVMQWVAWKYRLDGELYYSMNEAYAHNNNPWQNVRLSGGNGDGTLFYPGRPDRIGGHTEIPIESIRLKLIREGMEDYEYLALLAKLDSPQAAAQFAERIVRKPYSWESRPTAFLKVRQEMGETLDRAAKARETM